MTSTSPAEDNLMLRRALRWLDRVTTGTDGGQLIIWASIALAAGALPDLIVGGSTALGLPQYSLLLAGWVMAVALAGNYAVKNLRRRGIAVFIHLPGRGDSDSPLTELRRLSISFSTSIGRGFAPAQSLRRNDGVALPIE